MSGCGHHAAFGDAGVDLSAPMVSTCGSGVTAAIVTLAAHLLNKEVPLYDVSCQCSKDNCLIVMIAGVVG